MAEKNMPVRFGVIAIALFFMGITGCGSSQGSVSGKVTYKGEIVGGGSIMFLAEDGRGLGRSTIAEDGTYKIDNVPTGNVTIIVETQSAKPVNAPKDFFKNMPKDLPPAAKTVYNSTVKRGKYLEIPTKFGDPKLSGLTYLVSGGSQTKNFDLK